MNSAVYRRRFASGVLAIVAWLLTATLLHANRVSQFAIFPNTDYLSTGVGGMRNFGYGTINLTNLTGAVTKAYLYWHGPMTAQATNSPGNAVVTVNSQTVVGTEIGLGSDNCWGGASYNYSLSKAYRADITSIVATNRNGSYHLTNFMKSLGTNSQAINVNGASLVVFYDDGITNNNNDVIILDGNDSADPSRFTTNNPAYDDIGWSFRLTNFSYRTGPARVELHVSDGQYFEPLDDGPLYFGMNILLAPQGHTFSGDTSYMPSANNGPTGNGCLWDIKSWAIDNLMTNGQTAMSVTNRYIIADCTALIAAVVILPAGSLVQPIVQKFGQEPGNAFKLTISGKTGQVFSVLGSTNLRDWRVLGTADPVSSELYQFIDSESPRPPQRFYRISSP